MTSTALSVNTDEYIYDDSSINATKTGLAMAADCTFVTPVDMSEDGYAWQIQVWFSQAAIDAAATSKSTLQLYMNEGVYWASWTEQKVNLVAGWNTVKFNIADVEGLEGGGGGIPPDWTAIERFRFRYWAENDTDTFGVGNIILDGLTGDGISAIRMSFNSTDPTKVFFRFDNGRIQNGTFGQYDISDGDWHHFLLKHTTATKNFTPIISYHMIMTALIKVENMITFPIFIASLLT